jgi:ribonuclease HI
MAQDTWTIHTDGGSRGNPGPAAAAFIIERPGAPDWEESFCLGQTTNNIAEYTGLLRALERAKQLGGQRLSIFSDSELLVKQMNGQYRVKNADLKELFDRAQTLKDTFDKVTIKHVYREENERADKLCNEALDGYPATPFDPDVETVAYVDPLERARGEALVYLRTSGVADAAEAWQRLLEILMKNDLLVS